MGRRKSEEPKLLSEEDLVALLKSSNVTDRVSKRNILTKQLPLAKGVIVSTGSLGKLLAKLGRSSPTDKRNNPELIGLGKALASDGILELVDENGKPIAEHAKGTPWLWKVK